MNHRCSLGTFEAPRQSEADERGQVPGPDDAWYPPPAGPSESAVSRVPVSLG